MVIDIEDHQQFHHCQTFNEKYVSVRFFKIIDAVVACGLEMHKVVANNISTIKWKTIEFYKDEENKSTEKFDSPMLWDISDTLPLPETNVNVFTSPKKLGGKDIFKDVTILVSNITESRETALFVIGYVGTREKREFIKDTFSSINEHHTEHSRETSLEKMILQRTDGTGRFLENGKFDLAVSNQLSSKLFMKGICFHGLMLDQIIYHKDQVETALHVSRKAYGKTHTVDPMCKMMLKHTYKAIIDAGINPEDIRESRTGVFISVSLSDSETTLLYGKYQLGVTGPSYNVDTTCSSSHSAMKYAYRAIRSGQCDYEIVSGSNLCLHLYVTLQFARLDTDYTKFCCKVFDEGANGYTRSECVSVAFLQKAKSAKRINVAIIHAETNCDGYKKEGMTYPRKKIQSTLFEIFYKDAVVDTNDLTNPLKVEFVKSHIGHTEPANGISSIVKAIISMKSGIIPLNINFNGLRKDVKGLIGGRIDVVTQLTCLDGEYIAINSFDFGGGNAHVLLKSNPKIKINKELLCNDLSRLVAVSGRIAEAVENILNEKSICFVFPGMDSQWSEICKDLMKFPTFAKVIEKCDAMLKPRKLHIYEILTSADNILHSFVGIAAT
ncbi:hypothetical protein HZH66_003662 [Vespula vulgaris]|uniref:Ketosynthase family 3 (KS3) domain-containing protein n=1 Tax=Vespula vulgaris TaxID=7454 RepID=A0A834KFD4_VESVU|nr:hypothetical protein HZH66_003662 [Vespula vulgaris]